VAHVGREKDLVAFNLMIRQAIRKVGNYAYCLPTFKQCRLVIWDSITNHGQRFLDYIPKELIKSINSQELRITLHNGSHIQLIGSDSYDTALVGTNFRFVCLSEYALCDERVYALVRPILNANGGILMILSTPRGQNHLHTLYNIAQANPDQWYCSKLTLDDTKHIDVEEIQKEIDSGEISKEMVQQEYYISFDLGASGSYYGKYLDEMNLNGQITSVMWQSEFPVSTAWDIGVRDSTCIIWFQRIGRNIHIIDCYENSKEGLEHYIKIIQNKPYIYDKHWAPHDIAVKEFGSGLTRLEKARQLGLRFETREAGTRSGLPHISIEDGIEACRSTFSRLYIDEKRCSELIKALSNYRQEYDEKHKVYKNRPLHDKNSHFADAFRYLVLSLSRTRDSQTNAEELERRYLQTVHGQSELPGFFGNDKFRSHEWRY